jgi:hypothetical protein
MSDWLVAVQKIRSGVSEAAAVSELGNKHETSVPSGPFKGYVETAFSSATARYYYKGSKQNSLNRSGGFSTVEEYASLFYLRDMCFSAHVLLGNAGVPAPLLWEGLGLPILYRCGSTKATKRFKHIHVATQIAK